MAKPQHDGSSRTQIVASVCRSDTNQMRRRDAKSFVDDLVLSRGVVLSRAVLFCDLLRLSPLTRRFVRFRRTRLRSRGSSTGRLVFASDDTPSYRSCDLRCRCATVPVVVGVFDRTKTCVLTSTQIFETVVRAVGAARPEGLCSLQTDTPSYRSCELCYRPCRRRRRV